MKNKEFTVADQSRHHGVSVQMSTNGDISAEIKRLFGRIVLGLSFARKPLLKWRWRMLAMLIR
ncbi:uncharacterized protein PHALS_15346 [Plasmopara halstedii]|uniref:Uncharacterized protein n=1 Tax=Plasmopara halstedii TaxID=4781 RepID=A0A0P1ATI5_PLAHL|nr:uncharacterized protein PHALS_15346 [Plasmopara halstedii]CEG44599.1 hypothetical protein PHALS_15346 [Plasmopara halstedii]|eukprot:XP_024580968.1 hypothetical protein PHALS_15346 [Plasmopara halstedii]